MAAHSIESRPDQGTDIEMTESLTLTCYLSLSRSQRDWPFLIDLANQVASLTRCGQEEEEEEDRAERRSPSGSSPIGTEVVASRCSWRIIWRVQI